MRVGERMRRGVSRRSQLGSRTYPVKRNKKVFAIGSNNLTTPRNAKNRTTARGEGEDSVPIPGGKKESDLQAQMTGTALSYPPTVNELLVKHSPWSRGVHKQGVVMRGLTRRKLCLQQWFLTRSCKPEARAWRKRSGRTLHLSKEATTVRWGRWATVISC